MTRDLQPVAFDLADIDLHRQTAAMELLDRRGAYYDVVDGRLRVPRRHAADVADVLFPGVGDDPSRWA